MPTFTRTVWSKPHWSELPPISQKELTKMKLKGDRVSELAIKILNNL